LIKEYIKNINQFINFLNVIILILYTFNIFSEVFKMKAWIWTIESSLEYNNLSISFNRFDLASCELIPIKSDIFFDLNINFEFLLILYEFSFLHNNKQIYFSIK